jgi:hypothetical protein
MVKYWRVFLVVFVLMGFGAYQLYGIFSNEGYQPEQPIAFSHVMHAGVLQMECLYCHHQAEKGPHAGIPSVDLCMGCHGIVRTDSPEIQKLTEYFEKGEPVPWVRIHRLPDHAYFNHRWHVSAGVACQECHGPIQSMPVVKQWDKLEMGRCMECHLGDEYVKQVNHAPTFHEAPEHGDEQVEDKITDEEAWQSAKGYIAKYLKDDFSADEAELMAGQLARYHEDIYRVGRPAQLRGQNASVECSTCHN